MARLNPDPGIRAKRYTSLSTLSSSPTPSSSPDNTVTTCLGVIPQNDLYKIANRTDIAEFIERGDRDLESALKVAQDIVHNRHRISQDVALHCAFDIRTVWHEVADYKSRTPTATATITQWQQDIRRDIDIDRYLSMADSTLQKYSRYIDRIQLAWGMPINIALPQGLIPPFGGLSKSLMQKMAELAERTSREEAAILLKENVSRRTGYLTRTAHTRTSPYLMLSDVSSALEQSRAKVSKAPQPGKRAYAGPTGNARKKRKGVTAQDAGSTRTEDKKVNDDQAASHVDFDSNEMSIEQGRGVDMANLDGFDNTTRSSWPLECSAPPTPISGQPLRLSELPDVLNSDPMVSNDTVAAVARTTVEPHHKGHPPPISEQQVMCTAMAALVSDKAVRMVRTTGKSTDVEGVIESHPAGKQPVDCTTDIGVDHDRAQASSRQYGQDTSSDSDMSASENRRTALLTLQPGKQLSSTAIYEVLSCVKPTDCYVFDPLFFKNSPVFRFSKGFQIEDTITRILLPIHDSQRKHWYLAVLMISDSTIKIYDSISCKEQSLSQSTHLESFARTVKPQQQAWTVRLAECPQQHNGYDCGIYTIVNALQVMVQGSLPAAYDCATWRLLCRSLLGESVNNDQFDSLVGIADSKTKDFTPSDTQANDQDNWIIDTLQQAVREAEIRLTALRTKQTLLQSSHDASRSSLHTLRVLHDLACKEINDFPKRITDLQGQLRSHADILERYTSITIGMPVNQPPEMQKTLCSIQSTQTVMERRLWREERKAKSLEGNIVRLSAAISTGQRMEEIWATKIQQVESERQAKVQQMESWREHCNSFSTQIAQLLAKHRSLEESIYS